nr:MAG TPA: hypothetical protein [Caudoviricetes sp.]
MIVKPELRASSTGFFHGISSKPDGSRQYRSRIRAPILGSINYHTSQP